MANQQQFTWPTNKNKHGKQIAIDTAKTKQKTGQPTSVNTTKQQQ
jgi:hypothetical protein